MTSRAPVWCTVGTVREGLIGDPTAGQRMPAALFTAHLSAEAAALNGRSALACPWDPASADTRERVLAKTWLSRHRRALDAIAACPGTVKPKVVRREALFVRMEVRDRPWPGRRSGWVKLAAA
jgi:hypothetical protein